MRLIVAAACAASLLTVAPALAFDVVELQAAKDNTLFQDLSGNTSNGAGQHFFVGKTGFNSSTPVRRGVIAFDVGSAVPPGSTIVSVSLTLNMSRTIAGSQDISLHRALNDWGEGGSDAAGQEGTGAVAEPGDATWLHTFHPGSFWDTNGGDFEAAPSATAAVVGAGAYSWGSNPDMVADVQTWLDDGASNFGWVILGNEGSFFTAKRFDTREHPTASRRPVLTVEFTTGGQCPPDVNGDGTVNVFDLLAVLSAWGPAGAGTPADINGDGTVNVFDLLEVLASWGPCP